MPAEWEQIFANHTSGRGLISRVCKSSQSSTLKNPVRSRTKDMPSHFCRAPTSGQVRSGWTRSAAQAGLRLSAAPRMRAPARIRRLPLSRGAPGPTGAWWSWAHVLGASGPGGGPTGALGEQRPPQRASNGAECEGLVRAAHPPLPARRGRVSRPGAAQPLGKALGFPAEAPPGRRRS